jgi:ABC-type amino acid transport substrate-binding protein
MILRSALAAGLVLGMLVSACAPAPAAPAPADPHWDRIQQAGKLIVGTAGDYPPFEYYNPQFQLDGFDIALMNAIGQKLQLPIEYNNFAFDGLPAALQIGQIDAAIAAISVTDERLSVVDFSNVYYIGSGAALAKAGSGIGTVTTLEQLVQYRVGVQDGSIYQTQLQDLVAFGQMPAENLVPFIQADEGLTALRQGLIDLFVMDDAPAEQAIAAGGVELAGTGVAQQRYAVALPKGSSTLQAEINRALIDLTNDGTIAHLIEFYMRYKPAEVPPPAPPPTAVPVPTSTPAPGACSDGMAWVKDLSYDDEDMEDPPDLDPGEDFEKGWRIENVGTCKWTEDYSIRYVYGNKPEAKMDGKNTYVDGSVKPNETYDMYVELEAPDKSGTYQGFWQMYNALGQAFGETVWVGIHVEDDHPDKTSTPTPKITPTPTNTLEPATVPPPPEINAFSAQPAELTVGACVELSWSFTGTDLAAAYINRNDIVILDGVPLTGSEQDCSITEPGTYLYELQVSSEFGGSAYSRAQVEVTAP